MRQDMEDDVVKIEKADSTDEEVVNALGDVFNALVVLDKSARIRVMRSVATFYEIEHLFRSDY